jgi:hypothetical protein
MDFGNAALLASTVFLIVELVGRIFPALGGREKIIVAFLAGQLSTFLVAQSDWGSKQIVDGIALDSMNWYSLAIVGLALAGLAVIGKQVIGSIANIGENQP